jgi:mannan endo-1,4-beta-mannosidase
MTALIAALLLLQAPASGPANPSANLKARAVLDYLVKLPSQGPKRILSGQFTDYGPGAKVALCEEAFRQTGHWPAMIGLDYADYSQGQHRLHTATVN